MSLKQQINDLYSELKKMIPRLEQSWDDRVPKMKNKKFVHACYCIDALRLCGVHT